MGALNPKTLKTLTHGRSLFRPLTQVLTIIKPSNDHKTKIESTKCEMLRWTENSTIKYAHKWRRGEWKEFTHRETYSLCFIGLNIIITHHLPITNNAEVRTTADKCKGYTARLGESQQPANRGSWTSHLATLIYIDTYLNTAGLTLYYYSPSKGSFIMNIVYMLGLITLIWFVSWKEISLKNKMSSTFT